MPESSGAPLTALLICLAKSPLKMPSKKRLDLLLVERELVDTRSRAAARVMAGDVFVNGQRCTKAGTKLAENVALELRGDALPYVSRGGLKLEAALKAFDLSCQDLLVLDVGASTGGFTDCVLQHGARHVWAVDVGYGQLAWRLRTDDRVTNLERSNIRSLDPELVPEPCDLAVMDCSFISLEKILEPTLPFLTPNARIIALIKPQFEVGRAQIARGGVVRDQRARQQAIARVKAYASTLGLQALDGIDCPVHGPAGNVEYLALFERSPSP